MLPSTPVSQSFPEQSSGVGVRQYKKAELKKNSFKSSQTDAFLLGLYHVVQLWNRRFQVIPDSKVTLYDEDTLELLFCERLIEIGRASEANYGNLLHRYWYQGFVPGFNSSTSSSKKGISKNGCCEVLLKRLWKQHENRKNIGLNNKSTAALEKKHMKVGVMMLALDPVFQKAGVFFGDMKKGGQGRL